MADAEAEEGAPAEVAAEPAGPVAAPELLEAAMLGKLGRLKAFLDKNPDQLNLTSVKRGWSTLQVAVGFSKMEIVAELIERGADVATVDNMGMTVLHTAAESDIDVLNALLATEAGKGLINKQDNVRGPSHHFPFPHRGPGRREKITHYLHGLARSLLSPAHIYFFDLRSTSRRMGACRCTIRPTAASWRTPPRSSRRAATRASRMRRARRLGRWPRR